MQINTRIHQEYQFMGQQPWLQAMLIWLPMTLFVCLWWIFSSAVVRDLPIGVVDFEQSQLSREVIRYYDVSPTLAIDKSYQSVEEGKQDLVSGKIYALAVIPHDLMKDVVTGHPPTITTFYNSQFILMGKLVGSAMQQAQGTMNAHIDAAKNMSRGDTPPQQALAEAVPIQTQITPLFNSNSHYGQFLVSAMIPAIWQIFIVATTVLSFSLMLPARSIQQWLGDSPVQALAYKLLPYSLIYILQGGAFLSVLYVWLGWPMHGSWWILLLGQIAMVFACQSMGAFFFMLTLDATRAMSFAAAFTAPAFAFMGITFPASDMPVLAQIWRNLLPVSHYIEIQVNQVNLGVGFTATIKHLLILVAFGLALIPTYLKARLLSIKSAHHPVAKDEII